MIKSAFITVKLYFERAKIYTSYLNFFMIIWLFIRDIGWPLWSVAFFVVGALVVGFFDVKLGLFGREQALNWRLNPAFDDLLAEFAELKRLVGEGK